MAESLPEVAHSVLLCVTGALIAVLLLRLPLRRAFGARIAYQIWLLIPIAAVGAVVGSFAPAGVLAPISLSIQLSDVQWRGSPSPTMPALLEERYWMIAGWMIGAVIFALIQGWQQYAFVRRLGTLQRVPDGAWISETEDIGPVVVGVFPPKIVLPADFHQRYTTQEQTMVLAHEAMHIRRRDPLANLSAAIVRSLLWFHPLLHLAMRYFRIDQEFACDAAVLGIHPQERQHYAYAMLKGQIGGRTLPAGCRLDSHAAKYLKRRILMLHMSLPSRGRRVLGGAVTFACLIIGFALPLPTSALAQTTLANLAGTWSLNPLDSGTLAVASPDGSGVTVMDRDSGSPVLVTPVSGISMTINSDSTVTTTSTTDIGTVVDRWAGRVVGLQGDTLTIKTVNPVTKKEEKVILIARDNQKSLHFVEDAGVSFSKHVPSKP